METAEQQTGRTILFYVLIFFFHVRFFTYEYIFVAILFLLQFTYILGENNQKKTK